MSHNKSDSLRQSADLKLQVQEFEHEISTIPAIVNGVAIKTNPKYNSESRCAFRDVINHHIDNLRVTIENCNKCVNSPNITHKIVLTGDSHIKGFSRELRSVLKNEYELNSLVKPGSNSNMLCESLNETVSQRSQDDQLVICCGSNDFELNNFDSTFRNIRNCLATMKHSNIVILSVPFRYDLQNCTVVNSKLLQLNKKLHKLTRAIPYFNFPYSNNDSKLFTSHGLRRNNLRKKLIITQIVSCILYIFQNKILPPLPLGWYELTEELKLHPETSQTKTSTRNSSHFKKKPVTRSNDFLW